MTAVTTVTAVAVHEAAKIFRGTSAPTLARELPGQPSF